MAKPAESVEAKLNALRQTDLIIGLQAEADAARAVAARETALRERLEERVERQKLRIEQLERQGVLGRLRRVKRRLNN